MRGIRFFPHSFSPACEGKRTPHRSAQPTKLKPTDQANLIVLRLSLLGRHITLYAVSHPCTRLIFFFTSALQKVRPGAGWNDVVSLLCARWDRRCTARLDLGGGSEGSQSFQLGSVYRIGLPFVSRGGNMRETGYALVSCSGKKNKVLFKCISVLVLNLERRTAHYS